MTRNRLGAVVFALSSSLAVAACTSILGDFTSGPGPSDAGGSDGTVDEGTDAGADVAAETSAPTEAGIDAPKDSPAQETSTCNGGGAPCSPSACHTGTTSCDGGAMTCTPQGVESNGTSCGDGGVCSSGQCVQCAVGANCADAGSCTTATIACSTGMPVCTTGGNAPNGTPCGTNEYCDNGACAPCTNGAPCTPSNPCHTGTATCANGGITCTDTGSNATNGTTCGTNMVCNAGACVSCTAGASCNPSGNVCQMGTTSCSTGMSTCSNVSNVGNGTGCGTNMVCDNGQCVACTANQSCTPGGNACHAGLTSCSTGAQTCTDEGAVNDGTSCGSGNICCGGSCATCSTPANATPDCTGGTCGFTCNGGYSLCSGTCLATTSDPNNCGGCGHSCQGGTCTNGLCVPTLVCTSSHDMGYGIAVTGNSVFFTSNVSGTGAYVETCPITAVNATATTIHTVSGNPSLGRIIYDTQSNLLYVGDNNQSSTYALTTSGATQWTVPTNAFALATDNANLYMGTGSGVQSVSKFSGGTITTINNAYTYQRGMAYDPMLARVWAATPNSDAVQQCPTTAGGCTAFLQAANTAPFDIHVTGPYVFFLDDSSGGLYRCTSDNDCSTSTQFSSWIGTGFALDANNVYFTDYNFNMYSCPVTGCPGGSPALLASFGSGNGGAITMAVDSTYLYWVTNQGRVYKVAK